MTGPARDRDPGLQPERTRLAWRRTTLSAVAVAVLAVKAALHGGASISGVLACARYCALWLGFLAVAHRRIRALSSGADRPPPMSPRHATAATLCTVALAVGAAALLF